MSLRDVALILLIAGATINFIVLYVIEWSPSRYTQNVSNAPAGQFYIYYISPARNLNISIFTSDSVEVEIERYGFTEGKLDSIRLVVDGEEEIEFEQDTKVTYVISVKKDYGVGVRIIFISWGIDKNYLYTSYFIMLLGIVIGLIDIIYGKIK